MLFNLLIIDIFASSRHIKILTKDRAYELAVQSTRSLDNDIVLVPSTFKNTKTNVFLYDLNMGGIRTINNRYLVKGDIGIYSKTKLLLNDNKTSKDDWKISPSTDYNKIASTERICFQQGDKVLTNNYYELILAPCNETDFNQQFIVIDIDRFVSKKEGDVNFSDLTNVLKEPMFLGI